MQLRGHPILSIMEKGGKGGKKKNNRNQRKPQELGIGEKDVASCENEVMGGEAGLGIASGSNDLLGSHDPLPHSSV